MDFVQDGYHYWNFNSIQEFESYALREIDKVCRRNRIHYYLAYGTLLGAERHGGSIPWDMDADIYIPQQEVQNFVKCARNEFPNDLYVNFYDINPQYIYTYPQIGRKGFSTDGMHIDVYTLFGLPRGKKNEIKYINKIEIQRILYRARLNIWESRIPKFEKLRFNRFYRLLVRKYALHYPASYFTSKMEKLGQKYDMFTECDNIYDGMRVFPAKWFGDGSECNYDGASLIGPKMKEEYLRRRYKDYTKLPENRCYQYIRYTIVNDDIPKKRVAYIDDFSNFSIEKYKNIEKLYKESGCIIVIANVYKLSANQKDISIHMAQSMKYFDYVFINDINELEEEKIIEMISPSNIIRG